MRGCTSDSNFPSSPPDSSPQGFLSQDVYSLPGPALEGTPACLLWIWAGAQVQCKTGEWDQVYSEFLAMAETDPKGEKRGFLSL